MKNYLVIGGSSGIGKDIVKQLKNKGDVWATYNKEIPPEGDAVNYHHFEVNGDMSVLDEFPEIIDGLVYCPGSINLKPFARTKDEEFIKDYELQVLGAIKVIRRLLPNLKKSGTASIVLFSTIAVQKGYGFHSIVSSSKGAIEGLVRSLSAEFAPLIRVNAVAPSLTNTNLANRFLNTENKLAAQIDANPMKKIGEPGEVAKAACFLITSESSWITGQVIHVDGGQSVIG